MAWQTPVLYNKTMYDRFVVQGVGFKMALISCSLVTDYEIFGVTWCCRLQDRFQFFFIKLHLSADGETEGLNFLGHPTALLKWKMLHDMKLVINCQEGKMTWSICDPFIIIYHHFIQWARQWEFQRKSAVFDVKFEWPLLMEFMCSIVISLKYVLCLPLRPLK